MQYVAYTFRSGGLRGASALKSIIFFIIPIVLKFYIQVIFFLYFFRKKGALLNEQCCSQFSTFSKVYFTSVVWETILSNLSKDIFEFLFSSYAFFNAFFEKSEKNVFSRKLRSI